MSIDLHLPCTHHIETVLSDDAVAKLDVKGCHAISLTLSTCPRRAMRHLAAGMSHSRTVWSKLQLARTSPPWW